MQRADQQLAAYCAKTTWRQSLVFWVGFAFETLRGHSLAKLASLRLGKGMQLEITGQENLPRNGVFTLAVNHFKAQLTIDGISAVLTATNSSRPDLQNQYFIVTGQRSSPPRNGIVRLMTSILRGFTDRVYQQWKKHLIRISLKRELPSIKSLREWRARANYQPGLVFPEGEAGLQFGAIRPNAGCWLGTLPMPTVPVGVWWYEGKWHVSFGQPIKWSHRSNLHDLQLGLVIAQLLPVDLVSQWQEDLLQWHMAHQQNI